MKDICYLLGMEHNFTTAYHPQPNRQTEHFNKTLITILSKYAQNKLNNWNEMISYVLFAYSTTIHDSTLETYFYLTYKRDPAIPTDVALQYQNLPLAEPTDYQNAISSKRN